MVTEQSAFASPVELCLEIKMQNSEYHRATLFDPSWSETRNCAVKLAACIAYAGTSATIANLYDIRTMASPSGAVTGAVRLVSSDRFACGVAA